MRKLLLLLTALVLAATFLMAAGERAAISGTVSDKTGAVIPGVTVRALNTATNQTMETVSNDSGFYSFPSLILGNYKVEAELEGFQKFQQTGLKLEVGANVRLDISLQVGNLSDVVTVEANVDMVTTTDATLGQVIRLLDGPLAPIRCVSKTAYVPCSCPDESTCGLRSVMQDVRDLIAGVLDSTTLADVCERTKKLEMREASRANRPVAIGA